MPLLKLRNWEWKKAYHQLGILEHAIVPPSIALFTLTSNSFPGFQTRISPRFSLRCRVLNLDLLLAKHIALAEILLLSFKYTVSPNISVMSVSRVRFPLMHILCEEKKVGS